ncbi:hypothetical protein SteCoe_32462 [Stentor coeruleus]|uniref:DNA topoisomerase (ATP-hydrolyzing) n=1 Tax=Stentor coeruleus TaxID=5963 RepID=A0A1R2AZ23_9CILI|nr:hypothetical protein SteCoe_32462 [Stentor coeruleus]
MRETLSNLKNLTHAFWAEFKTKDLSSLSFSEQIPTQEVQARIEYIVINLIQQIFSTGTIKLSLLDQSKSSKYNPLTFINEIQEFKTNNLSAGRSLSSVAQLIKILETVYTLLESGNKATKREVFYMAPEIFENQLKSDRAIERASALLEVPRNRLNIISAGKGLISGSLVFAENYIETPVGNRIVKIPQDMDLITDIKTDADFVLVIEKETVLNRLVQEKFFDSCKCIGITGCGYPDLQTREFAKRVINEFSWIPVLVLTDFDPHGVKILTTYTFGSLNRAGECDQLALPFAHWIGVHSHEGFNKLPLSSNDYKVMNKLLSSYVFNLPPSNYQNKRFCLWRSQLEEMQKSGTKFEIEGISEGSLTEYILMKLQSGGWI